jgi:drug/metabolite transporter (DMT)-like permease
VAFGISDFLAGVRGRSMPFLLLLGISQPVGLALVAAVVLLHHPEPPGGRFALYSAAAGVAGILGLAAFWRAMAVGTISVVAPLTSMSAVVPLAAGLARGERPSPLQLGGVVLGIFGVALVSWRPSDDGAPRRGVAAGVGLACVAAVSFGVNVIFFRAAGDADVFWNVLVARASASALVVAALVVVARRQSDLAVMSSHFRAVAVIGVIDVTANILLAAASTTGLLSIVGVLISLHTVVTILLARIVLGERLAPLQKVGAVAALLAAASMSTG